MKEEMTSPIADTRHACQNRRRPNHDKHSNHAKYFSRSLILEVFRHRYFFEEANLKKNT
jgi:hypothetical protein